MRFLVLWWKGSSPQSTCKWRNMNHKRKICKYTTKYNYFMSTKRRCPLPWKVLCPGSYLQLLTWQLLRKSTDKVWGMVRAHRPRLKASAQAIHSYTLMCTVCTDSVQEQIAPKNTLHSTMLSENDTFFTVLKNTEKERVQVLGMTNWKDIAQIFLQSVSEQILSSSLQCKCASSYSYAVEHHKPQTGKCPQHTVQSVATLIPGSQMKQRNVTRTADWQMQGHNHQELVKSSSHGKYQQQLLSHRD